MTNVGLSNDDVFISELLFDVFFAKAVLDTVLGVGVVAAGLLLKFKQSKNLNLTDIYGNVSNSFVISNASNSSIVRA